MELAPGSRFLDKFEVERKLAEGGMGVLYAVTQLGLGVRRALKLLRPELSADPNFVKLFLREARLGAQLQSPNVVQVFDVGLLTPPGIPWMLLELLDGQSFADHMAAEGVIPAASLVALFDQLGAGLDKAHAHQIIHRDLKPDNIFLHRDGPRTVLKVLDFGIAKAISEGNSTDVTSALGTPEWMSPEQAATGAKISVRTDVWPIGLMAFRALTGKQYWRESNAPRPHFRRLVGEVCFGELPTASARAAEYGLADKLPRGFDGWFSRCVDRDPERRFPGASAATSAFAGLFQSGVAPTVMLQEPPRPVDPVALRLSQLLAAMTAAEQAARPHEVIQAGEQALALATSDAALRVRVASAYLQRARMLDASGVAASALDDLGRALSLHPSQPDAWALRAELLARGGRHGEAVVSWSEALALAPKIRAWLDARARSFDALGQPAMARADRALAALNVS